MRHVGDESQFTPLGMWVRQYLRDSSDGLSVTNLDFIIEDFKHKKIQLLEEKQQGGNLHRGQLLTFNVLDQCLEKVAPRVGYEYCGFFVLQFPKGATMPGPGMKMNGQTITNEQLRDHLNFTTMFCEPFQLPWRSRGDA